MNIQHSHRRQRLLHDEDVHTFVNKELDYIKTNLGVDDFTAIYFDFDELVADLGYPKDFDNGPRYHPIDLTSMAIPRGQQCDGCNLAHVKKPGTCAVEFWFTDRGHTRAQYLHTQYAVLTESRFLYSPEHGVRLARVFSPLTPTFELTGIAGAKVLWRIPFFGDIESIITLQRHRQERRRQLQLEALNHRRNRPEEDDDASSGDSLSDRDFELQRRNQEGNLERVHNGEIRHVGDDERDDPQHEERRRIAEQVFEDDDMFPEDQ